MHPLGGVSVGECSLMWSCSTAPSFFLSMTPIAFQTHFSIVLRLLTSASQTSTGVGLPSLACHGEVPAEKEHTHQGLLTTQG